MIKARLVNIGARIPADLKNTISQHCDKHGMKMQFFVTQAIREKLMDLREDELDNAIVDDRLKNPKFTSMEDLQKYIRARKQG